jgi:hypothetical protein
MSKIKQGASAPVHESTHKRTNQGGRKVKTSSMNKHAKRSYKKNRGQGK